MIPAWLTTTPIAHRGLHNGAAAPENSLAAFEKAMEQGYAIECDIHLLKDGRIAVFHDYDLQRMCGTHTAISSLTYTQVSKYRLLETDQRIPVLEDLLAMVHGNTPLLIEIKKQRLNKQMQKSLAKALMQYNGDVAIQSFDPFAMRLLPQLLPHVPRGQLSGSLKDENLNRLTRWVLQHYALNHISKPAFVAHEAADIHCNSMVARLKAKGMPVLCWTVRSRTEYEQVAPYCDNTIFEGFVPGS